MSLCGVRRGKSSKRVRPKVQFGFCYLKGEQEEPQSNCGHTAQNHLWQNNIISKEANNNPQNCRFLHQWTTYFHLAINFPFYF